MSDRSSARAVKTVDRDILVKKIDHLMIQTPDPDALFELFATTLGLPVTADVASRSGYRSGGVTVGNLSLEFISFDGASTPPAGTSRVVGLALHPTVTALEAHRTLTDRGIEHGPPIVYRGAIPQRYRPYLETPRVTTGPINTNVEVNGLIGDRDIIMADYAGVVDGRIHEVAGRVIGWALGRPRLARRLMASQSFEVPLVQLVEYHHDVDQRRRDDADRLDDADGGVLGITGAVEIVATVQDPDGVGQRWETVLGRQLDSPDSVEFGRGPRLVFDRGESPSIDRCILEVESLDRCAKALDERGIRGPDGDDETLSIDPDTIDGLNIRLQEN